MKFLILNTDYPDFLRWLYNRHPALEKEPYAEQIRVRSESLFGMADFYSSNLCKLGQEAYDSYASNECLQKAWAREHGIRIGESIPAVWQNKTFLQNARRMAAQTPLRHIKPFIRQVLGLSSIHQPAWVYDILAEQIKYYKPDVLLNQAMDDISSRFLREMTPHIRLLAGQIAAPLPKGEDFSCYDLVISSLPSFVEDFRQMGLQSELQRLAFEPRVLDRLTDKENKIPVSFVGSLSRHHKDRLQLLEYLCTDIDIEIWGQFIDDLPKGSSIRRHCNGESWGAEMYQTLHNSKITLNNHINMAGRYAANMRLFEATGVGALLVTDWKANLHEMFEPGKEVVAYRTPQECAEMIKYYLGHDAERKAIASAGQARTLKDHTYYRRAEELIGITAKYL